MAINFNPDPKPEPRPKKEPKPIRKVSKRLSVDLNMYKVIRGRYLNENPICEKCHKQHSDQIHHKKGRENSLLYNDKYFFAVCDPCHKYIEANPEEAKLKRWSLSRLSR